MIHVKCNSYIWQNRLIFHRWPKKRIEMVQPMLMNLRSTKFFVKLKVIEIFVYLWMNYEKRTSWLFGYSSDVYKHKTKFISLTKCSPKCFVLYHLYWPHFSGHHIRPFKSGVLACEQVRLWETPAGNSHQNHNTRTSRNPGEVYSISCVLILSSCR